MSPTACGLRHPITRAWCVLLAVDEHDWHRAADGASWKARQDCEVVRYDGDGRPIRRSELPRALRRNG